MFEDTSMHLPASTKIQVKASSSFVMFKKHKQWKYSFKEDSKLKGCD